MDVLKQVDEALVAALKLDPTCEHEYTHRGGAIWTICDQCGKQWADDEGGFKPDPPNRTIEQILSALTALSTLTALRGLEWKPWEWLPIEQARDGEKLDMVGCHHTGTPTGWLKGIGYYKREAMETGFTHFVILPTPPKREVE